MENTVTLSTAEFVRSCIHSFLARTTMSA